MHLTHPQLDAAVAAMRAVLPLEYLADAILRRFFQDNHMLGAQDRAFIAETVFGILRHRFFLESLAKQVTPRALLLAFLVKFQGMNLRELTPLISEKEVKWLAEIKASKPDASPLAIRAEFPAWLVEKLQSCMPDQDILELGLSLQQPAPLDLRVNTILAKRDEVLEIFQPCLRGWLVAVAHRITVRLAITQHRSATALKSHDVSSRNTPPSPTAEVSWHEACAILHEELNRGGWPG